MYPLRLQTQPPVRGLLPDDVLNSTLPVDPAHNVPEDDVPHDAVAGDTSWPLLWQATFAVRQVLSRKFKETPGAPGLTLPALTVALYTPRAQSRCRWTPCHRQFRPPRKS